MRIVSTFSEAIGEVGRLLAETSYLVHPARWQGLDVSSKPEADMREILNVNFSVPLGGIEDLGTYQFQIQPNLPWADLHFDERVCGKPLNPGETWKSWPWALSADKHRTENDKFTHTYMERYWPSYPGRRGLRYLYGDLDDVVTQLKEEPETRQAYLPVFFPEDTGAIHRGRVPCTLGYHWIQRNGFLHTTYYIRSCDYYRHFRDDLYLTLRLSLWLLQQLRTRDSRWDQVRLGLFSFNCVSMHMFINEWRKVFGRT